MMTAVETTSATTDKPVVKKKKSSKFSPWSVVAWIAALGFFFPVCWMVLTANSSVLSSIPVWVQRWRTRHLPQECRRFLFCYWVFRLRLHCLFAR